MPPPPNVKPPLRSLQFWPECKAGGGFILGGGGLFMIFKSILSLSTLFCSRPFVISQLFSYLGASRPFTFFPPGHSTTGACLRPHHRPALGHGQVGMPGCRPRHARPLPRPQEGMWKYNPAKFSRVHYGISWLTILTFFISSTSNLRTKRVLNCPLIFGSVTEQISFRVFQIRCWYMDIFWGGHYPLFEKNCPYNRKSIFSKFLFLPPKDIFCVFLPIFWKFPSIVSPLIMQLNHGLHLTGACHHQRAVYWSIGPAAKRFLNTGFIAAKTIKWSALRELKYLFSLY